MNRTRTRTRAVSERDRRFALLAAMATADRRLALRRRPIRRDFITEDLRDQREHQQPVVAKANKDRMRAGVTGHNVRTVLCVSLALVIVLFVGVAAFIRP
jgi:hypothetical protein